MTKKELKKMLPSIAKEMQVKNTTGTITINSVRTEESKQTSHFTGYNPDIVDFLRRCNTDRDGLEIINFMEKRGEINHKHAEKLLKQLKEKGIRSFGPKKETNYYFKFK